MRYQSPHFHPYDYGIYFKEDCIDKIAHEFWNNHEEVYDRCVAAGSINPAIMSALGYLFIHELYHLSLRKLYTDELATLFLLFITLNVCKYFKIIIDQIVEEFDGINL